MTTIAVEGVNEYVPCPECGEPMILKNSKYGLFWGCPRWPECNGKHAAHQNSGKPMGIPGDKETREWRIKAHAIFDKFWKEWGMTRPEAYKLIETTLGLPKNKAHISMLDINQCKYLIKKFEEQAR